MMKLDSRLLTKLIREAMEDMSGDFGPDDPTEHAPSLTKEAVLDKIFEILLMHFKADFGTRGRVVLDEVESMYDRIASELGMGE
jgi:hypothetical protein